MYIPRHKGEVSVVIHDGISATRVRDAAMPILFYAAERHRRSPAAELPQPFDAHAARRRVAFALLRQQRHNSQTATHGSARSSSWLVLLIDASTAASAEPPLGPDQLSRRRWACRSRRQAASRFAAPPSAAAITARRGEPGSTQRARPSVGALRGLVEPRCWSRCPARRTGIASACNCSPHSGNCAPACHEPRRRCRVAFAITARARSTAASRRASGERRGLPSAGTRLVHRSHRRALRRAAEFTRRIMATRTHDQRGSEHRAASANDTPQITTPHRAPPPPRRQRPDRLSRCTDAPHLGRSD